MKTTVSKTLKTLMLVAVITLSAIAVQAQDNSATVQATGTVLQPLNVTGTDLTFGEIFPGLTADTEDAAIFTISGQAESEITATFDLPDFLEGPAGSTNITITFDSDDGSHATDQSAEGISFDPNSSLTTNLGEAGDLFIWLSGQITPDTDQTAGEYTADITLDLVYTGN